MDYWQTFWICLTIFFSLQQVENGCNNIANSIKDYTITMKKICEK